MLLGPRKGASGDEGGRAAAKHRRSNIKKVATVNREVPYGQKHSLTQANSQKSA